MMSNAARMIELGTKISMVLIALSGSAANAAEPASADTRGTLSQEATSAAGPAVNTSALPAQSEPSAPAAAPASQPSARRETTSGPQAVVRNDRLDLSATAVTGNRELPKVMYIVPWKKSDLGELPTQPFNTLLDEALTPVDRDVFRREVTYYGAVSGAADSAASQAERSEK
jgi:hypothetical protein